jgi:hypothetical protein
MAMDTALCHSGSHSGGLQYQIGTGIINALHDPRIAGRSRLI